MFEMVPTPESSKVAEIGYDSSSRELIVKLLNGESWVYFNVPGEEWGRLRAAKSKGMYVNIVIVPKYGRRTTRRSAPLKPL
jgi:KTSC domain